MTDAMGRLRLVLAASAAFYALFIACCTLPILRWLAARRGLREKEHWKYAKIPVSAATNA